MRLFDQGQRSYNEGQYQRALEQFQDAQSLYPSPAFHYNIGQCYEGLDKLEQAITSYRAYLRSNPQDRANVENKITRLEERIAQEKEASEAAPETQGQPEPAPEDDSQSKQKGQKQALALIGTGTALTLGGLGLALGGGIPAGFSASDYSDQVDAVNDTNPDNLTLVQARELETKGQDAQRNQILFMSIGGSVAAAGIVMLVVGLVKKSKLNAGGKNAKAQLAPTFSPQSAGLSLTGRF